MLARWETNGGKLHADGTILDADGSPGPELFMPLLTDVTWSRTYNVGRGLTGTFSGCFGETYGANGYGGNLFIYFERSKGQWTVRFIWHFDYYLTPGNTIREHFTLKSGKIPFPAWTGGNVAGRVAGTFDLQRFIKEGKPPSTDTSLTGGMGRFLEFDLTIERVP